MRAGVGNRIFGCDDCLAVCPWNKFAQTAREAKLAERDDLARLPLAHLAALDEPAFRALFAATPIKRIGHRRFLRNVLIALGNSRRPDLARSAVAHIAHADATVRGAAIWAASRLMPPDAFAALRDARAGLEGDSSVRAEWDQPIVGAQKA